jgi:hypothetical protein
MGAHSLLENNISLPIVPILAKKTIQGATFVKDGQVVLSLLAAA